MEKKTCVLLYMFQNALKVTRIVKYFFKVTCGKRKTN